MHRLVVIWFILLMPFLVPAWPDARFSAVRQLSAKQYQVFSGESQDDVNFKSSRSSRPLFSWEYIPPTPVDIFNATLSPEAPEHSLPAVQSMSMKGKHRRNKNKKKNLNTSIAEQRFRNQTDELENNGIVVKETGTRTRVQGFAHLNKEKRRKNKQRKDKTGRRKSKSESKKGEKNRKRKDRKLRKKGRKEKDPELISNSLPTVVNNNSHRHKSPRKFHVKQKTQLGPIDIPENRGIYKEHLSTTEKHLLSGTQTAGENEKNRIVHLVNGVNSPTGLQSTEINGAKDNALMPILHTPLIQEKEKHTDEKSTTELNGVGNRSTVSSVTDGYIFVSNITESSKEGSNDPFANNSLPTNIHAKVAQNETILPQSRKDNSALDTFNELHQKNHGALQKVNNTSVPDDQGNSGVEQIIVDYDTPISLIGDLSCLTGTFLPAPSMPNSAIKYIRAQNISQSQNNVYLIAEYECDSQHHLNESNSYQLICKDRHWFGQQPVCVSDDDEPVHRKECGEDRGGCEQICQIISNATVCTCYRGFRLEGSVCHDINECEFYNGGCESDCRNTPGSHQCLCPTGLRLADNGKNCVDVNECLLRNGHGPCQDLCHNLWGSYECSCDGIPGTKLATDNHTCQDVDECVDGTAGCSHTCLNTLGSAFCLCPSGFMLGNDWKTCQDIDECSYEELETEKCELGCINTIGSYHCLEPEEISNVLPQTATELPITCPDGFKMKTDGSCEDIDECEERSSGCSQGCLNTVGSFQCYCGLGFSLSSDNKTCIDGAEEAVCPPLDAPPHGYLECARHLVRMRKSKYPWMKRARVVNHAGSICQLKCPHGYVLEGEYRKTCGQDRKWTGPENGTCILLPAPNIRCPKNITAALKPGSSTAYVLIPQPITNVNWFRYVESHPAWGKLLEANLPLGHWEVQFTAKHPTSQLIASCTLAINITSYQQ